MNLRDDLRQLRAFAALGFQDAASYPLNLVLAQTAGMASVFAFFFIGKLTGEIQGGVDYLAFVLIGLAVYRFLGAGLDEFGDVAQRSIEQGQMEMYLVEPMNWRVLPYALSAFPLLVRGASTGVLLLAGFALGARFDVTDPLLVLVVVILGVVAVHAIGIVAFSVRILTKKLDPLTLVVSLTIGVFAGISFPVDLLPGVLRPFAYLFPHSYVADSLRLVTLPGSEPTLGLTAWQSAGALALYATGASVLGHVMLGVAIRHGRATGTLGTY